MVLFDRPRSKVREGMINVVSLPLLASLIRHRVLYSTTDGKSKDLLRSRQVANSNCHNAVSFSRQAIQEAVSQWLDFGSVLSTWGLTITFLGHLALMTKAAYNHGKYMQVQIRGTGLVKQQMETIYYLLHTICILHAKRPRLLLVVFSKRRNRNDM